MDEAEITSQIIYRTEILWNLTQWWVSISLAVIVASYVGAKHLTLALVSLIVFMYIFYSVALAQATGSHVGYLDALYGELVLLAETTDLSLIGQLSIEKTTLGSRMSLLSPFIFVSFFVTIGFVLFAYLRIKRNS